MDNEKIDILKVQDLIWTPVRTKPRQEKKLAEYCKVNSVRYYLPLKKRVKRYQRRTVESFLPMFPGYIFCVLNEDLYRKILESGTIVYRITMDETTEKRLISDLNVLQDFETLTQQNEVVVRPEIVSGVQITVNNGPLQGVSGVVEKRGDSTSLTVNVDILGQSVSTAIDVEDVDLEE